ncbi:hypothetical protein LVJ82_09760 [Vitreoscilla massiliensis]|uniref:ESPR domain-containing protein n=1 Tax=Vitreoscilla massiliensis TaxID=1689272 RepID=A0ABY4DZ33_9NEIS|nr:ESPR domain-containing protein [Vitreoscilla massiliensis]UOO87780.1 hypothetical protein LVJ82_09760 [Vitreoscilla massiliensis]
MNKIYKLVWNDALQTWVSVSEIFPSRGKKSTIIGSLTALGLAMLALPAHAASIGLRIDNGASNPTNLISTYNGRNVVPIFDDYSMQGIRVQNKSRLIYSNGTVSVDMTKGAVASNSNYPVGVYLDGSSAATSNVVNLNNAKINVKGSKGAIGIDDNDKNTVGLNNVTFNVVGGNGRTVGYDQYTYYECASSTPCPSRIATVKGTTVMNVSNTSNATSAGWMSAATLGTKATTNITGNSITNIRSTGLSKPYGYYVSSNGNINFNNAIISGTTNGKSDVYIRAGGTIRFIGTTKAISPLHILTKYGNVYFNQISGTSFVVDELRSLQGNTTSTGYDYGENGSDGGVYNSKVFLGDKTLFITGKHTTPNDRNYFSSSVYGSNKSRLIKQGSNTLSFNGNNSGFLGDLVVVGGVFQVMGGNMSNTKLTTVKTGATLAGNGSNTGSTGVVGKTIIDSGGTLQVGSTVNSNTSRQYFTINGDLLNNGNVRVYNSKGIVGNSLLVKGNYAGGNGSKLYMAFSQTKKIPATFTNLRPSIKTPWSSMAIAAAHLLCM